MLDCIFKFDKQIRRKYLEQTKGSTSKPIMHGDIQINSKQQKQQKT